MLKVGDIVTLKSGSEKMVIEELLDNGIKVRVTWWDGTYFVRAELHKDTLNKQEKKEK